ncbi:hypothetical protein BLOT_009970 [Blomia tropicalis]|nr:hypothetical protein BLOT_009970 [Blomia tropicalis]
MASLTFIIISKFCQSEAYVFGTFTCGNKEFKFEFIYPTIIWLKKERKKEMKQEQECDNFGSVDDLVCLRHQSQKTGGKGKNVNRQLTEVKVYFV